MTTTTFIPAPRRWLQVLAGRYAVQAVAVIGVGAAAALAIHLGHPHPHAPDLALLRRQPPVVLAHLATALFAFGLGTVMMVAPKGTLPHRTLGWIWVALMMTVAGSSLFIHGINKNGFSAIHILSAWVLFIVPVAVFSARRHNVRMHRRAMMGTFYLGLIIAGAFTFMPGRLMWNLFLG